MACISNMSPLKVLIYSCMIPIFFPLWYLIPNVGRLPSLFLLTDKYVSSGVCWSYFVKVLIWVLNHALLCNLTTDLHVMCFIAVQDCVILMALPVFISDNMLQRPGLIGPGNIFCHCPKKVLFLMLHFVQFCVTWKLWRVDTYPSLCAMPLFLLDDLFITSSSQSPLLLTTYIISELCYVA